MFRKLLYPLLIKFIIVCAAFLRQSNFAHASSCPQSPAGYYKPPTPGGAFVSGLPPATNLYTYITKPSTLSCSELSQAHQLCVERINMYRSGQLVFSNGSGDPTLGSPPPLQYASGMDRCHSEITLGDFALMGQCGAGAHQNAWSCDGFDYTWGQNLCCSRALSSTNTFQSLINTLYGCLQSMWDEGMHPTTGTTGHWINMKDPEFLYASCGFAFSDGPNPSVLMTQNFGGWYGGVATPLNASTSRPTVGITVAPTPPTANPTSLTTSKVPTLPPTFAPSSRSPSSNSPTSIAPTLTPSSRSPSSNSPTSIAPTFAPSSRSPSSNSPTSIAPTFAPSSRSPSSNSPTSIAPTMAPSSKVPTLSPTFMPSSRSPSSNSPTSIAPTIAPSSQTPTLPPTLAPSSRSPSSNSPTSIAPTIAPSSKAPTLSPTFTPSSTSPTSRPTLMATFEPTSNSATSTPSSAPATSQQSTASPTLDILIASSSPARKPTPKPTPYPSRRRLRRG